MAKNETRYCDLRVNPLDDPNKVTESHFRLHVPEDLLKALAEQGDHGIHFSIHDPKKRSIAEFIIDLEDEGQRVFVMMDRHPLMCVVYEREILIKCDDDGYRILEGQKCIFAKNGVPKALIRALATLLIH